MHATPRWLKVLAAVMECRVTDEQELLRASARDFLERECPTRWLRDVVEDPSATTDEVWKQLAELGWLGLVLPERLGGSGLGLVELALLLEEMGRVLLPVPFFSTLVLGALPLAWAENEAPREHLLPRIARGDARLTLAFLEEDPRWDPQALRLRAERTRGGFRLTGTKHFVPDAGAADHFLVPARLEEGEAGSVVLLLVPADAPSVATRRVAWHDLTRPVGEVRFDATPVGEDALLADPSHTPPLLERILDAARAMLSAEACGGMDRALALALAHARDREQFGQRIGSFQAIQHRCADMLVRLEASRSAAYEAAWAVENEVPDAHLAACLAKATCGEAFSRVAGDAIQIHGGSGFTWEQDPHLYYKRALANQLAFGTPTECRELAARVLLD